MQCNCCTLIQIVPRGIKVILSLGDAEVVFRYRPVLRRCVCESAATGSATPILLPHCRSANKERRNELRLIPRAQCSVLGGSYLCCHGDDVTGMHHIGSLYRCDLLVFGGGQSAPFLTVEHFALLPLASLLLKWCPIWTIANRNTLFSQSR